MFEPDESRISQTFLELQLGGCDGTATKSDITSFPGPEFGKNRDENAPPSWQYSSSQLGGMGTFYVLGVVQLQRV